MITIFFDIESGIPKYEQLYTQIKDMIQDNKLIANEKLPSKRRLAYHLEISQITVETAYAQLKAEGYIRSVEKSGYFVEPFTKLTIPQRTEEMENQTTKAKLKTYHYDLKTSKVDELSFPYELMAKFNRDSYLDGFNQRINDSELFGFKELREEIQTYLLAYRGIKTNLDQILICSGSEHMIQMILFLLGKNQRYAIETPGYPKSKKLYEAFGVKLDFISLDESGMDIEEINKTPSNILHISPSHQFPTGIVMPIKRRMELLSWANESKTRYIIEDDYDSEFRFSGNPIPALKGLDSFDKVIYLNSFSKSLSPTLRISYMVLPKPLATTLLDRYSFYANPVPIHDQVALSLFLKSKGFERHLNRMKLIYKEKRDLFIELLKKSEFGSVIKIEGEEAGLHFTLSFLDETDELQMIDYAKKQDLKIYGMEEFRFVSEDRSVTTFVIGYGSVKMEEFKEIVKRFERAWKNARNKIS